MYLRNFCFATPLFLFVLLAGCSLWGGDGKNEEPPLDTAVLPELELPEGLDMPIVQGETAIPEIHPDTLPPQSHLPEPPSLLNAAEAHVEDAIDLPEEIPHAYIKEEQGKVVLLLEEKFDYAWRRMALIMERIHLTIEDRDRTAGIYYISQLKETAEEGASWFNTVFRDEDELEKYRFRVVMKQEHTTEKELTRVVILDEKGKAEKDKIARTILSQVLQGMR